MENNKDKIYKCREGAQITGLNNLCQYLSQQGAIREMVEVGSYAGDSAEIFASVFKTINCVDLWRDDALNDGILEKFAPMSKVEERFDWILQKTNNNTPCKINKYKLSSEKASEQFDDSSLDFVYIDACHDYEAVKADISYWLPKVRKGGFIGGHDYDRHRLKQAVNELVKVERTFVDNSWIAKII